MTGDEEGRTMSPSNVQYTFDVPVSDRFDASHLWLELHAVARKFVFQRERDSNGSERYRGNLTSFRTRKVGEVLQGFRNRMSSTFRLTRFYGIPFTYTMSEQGRLAGPWTDVTIQPMQIPCEETETDLDPWEREIYASRNNYEARIFDVVYIPPEGCVDTGRLVRFLGSTGAGLPIPPIRSYRSFSQFLYELPTYPLYLVQLYAFEREKDLLFFVHWIVQLKDGNLCNGGYYKRQGMRMIRSPQVWVFTSARPEPIHGVWSDKMRTWCVDPATRRLVPYVYSTEDTERPVPAT